MKMTKKICAIALVFAMVMTSFVMPAAAAPSTSDMFNVVIEKALYGLVRIIDFMLPGADWYGRWTSKDDYVPEFFYEGEDETAGEDAVWSVGYGENSLLDGLAILNGEYFMAGTLEPIKGRVPSEIIDDQRVRAFAVSDGGGVVVYAVIDGFGISRGDVQKIREAFAATAKENNVVSVNVSALHQHSCIDTLGMNVPLIPALFKNVAVNMLGLDESHLIRKNQVFMNNLYNKVVDAMEQAVESMETGTLSYGNVNIKEYIYDKRTPEVVDEYIHRIRFVPDNEESRETWICSAAMHCTSLGAGPSEITADYPYYIEQELKDDANLVFILGPQLAITTEKDPIYAEMEKDPSLTGEAFMLYGKRLGEKIRSISNDEVLVPELNVIHKEIYLNADNPILTLAARQGILESVLVKLPFHRYQIVSEIGYMEFGGKLGVMLAPGEIAPELILGGAETAEESWTGDSWDYEPLADLAGVENVICYGLCNDQIGYVLPDNQYRSLLTENEEVNVVSRTSGSTMADGFIRVFEETIDWPCETPLPRPVETYYDRFVKNVLNSGEYTMSMVAEEEGAQVKFTLYKSEDESAYEGEADYNGIRLSFRYLEENGKGYVVFPFLKVYVIQDIDGEISEGFAGFEAEMNSAMSADKADYLGIITSAGYVCEAYRLDDGSICRYYFNADGLFKVETVTAEGTEVIDMTVKAGVSDESVFSVPEKYREVEIDDLEDMIGDYTF
ncbi:MAG: hypothetical protein IJB86_08985 [Clostridia bacterium]|nr:hypothetical protein [Clostridia bacterium]